MHMLIDMPEDQKNKSSPDLDGEFNSDTFGSGTPDSTESLLPHEVPGVAVPDPHEDRKAADPVASESYPYVWTM